MESVHEAWRDVKGYEGRYQVSDLGRVRNSRSGRLLRQKDARGYLGVTLFKRDARFFTGVHRLVAAAFIRPPLPGEQIDHIDGKKQNNCVDNLEWVTPKENIRRSIAGGLKVQARGERHGQCNSTAEQVRVAVALVKGGMPQYAAAKRVGKSKQWISRIFTGQTWKHLNLNLTNA